MNVLLTSPWIPAEIVRACGHQPRGIWLDTPRPGAAVPEGVCAFAQHLLGLTARHPASAVVFTTACDQARRAADAAADRARAPLFLFNLPATWHTPAARALYHAECARLVRFLVALGGHPPADHELRQTIQAYEAHRRALRALLPLLPGRAAAEALAAFFSEGPLPAPPVPRPPATSPDVPLALIGGPLLPSHWSLFDEIEARGGRVVLNATEPGERCLLPPLPAADKPRPPRRQEAHACGSCPPAMDELVDHYGEHAVDVFHRPNTRLYDWLAPRLRERRVRGLVLWAQVGCDLWRAEAATLRDAFCLPLLTLEAQLVRTGAARDTHRLAAFLESLP